LVTFSLLFPLLFTLSKKKKKKGRKIGKEHIDPELLCNKSIPQVVEGTQAAGLSHLEATTN
jgi:hypothetical protein